MQVKTIALASLFSVVLAGNAFAAQPASGEGPLFLNEAQAVSTLSRDAVRQEAIANPPLVNGYDSVSDAKSVRSTATRAQVRESTRDAIAHGFHVKSGESA
ncbi:hypothetical protein [Ottowia thiooxydans]|uniref:hypothetical protein n=1 Tax=Ottowia thiooxydans TaxID=219182 RepID=UPI000419B1DD|nr:hypothetical protein [Ottowia thiooxydans]